MDAPFETRKIDDDTLTIVTGNTLDNNNAHQMVEAITAAQKEGFKYIVIDMSRLEFLSSAGVGSIIGTVEISREKGGDIILLNLSDPILHVLKVLDLADFLTIKESTGAAASRNGSLGPGARNG